MTNKKHFPKTISQWELDYGLFTNLPRTIVLHDLSPSSLKFKRDILTLLTKYVSIVAHRCQSKKKKKKKKNENKNKNKKQ